MDPNETLRRLRAGAVTARLVRDGVEPSDEALDLADAVEALDEWLTRGGFLPAAWDHAPAQGVTVTLNTGGDAFRQEDGTLDRSEVARLLRVAADRIAQDEGYLLDANGNTAGTFNVRED